MGMHIDASRCGLRAEAAPSSANPHPELPRTQEGGDGFQAGTSLAIFWSCFIGWIMLQALKC